MHTDTALQAKMEEVGIALCGVYREMEQAERTRAVQLAQAEAAISVRQPLQPPQPVGPGPGAQGKPSFAFAGTGTRCSAPLPPLARPQEHIKPIGGDALGWVGDSRWVTVMSSSGPLKPNQTRTAEQRVRSTGLPSLFLTPRMMPYPVTTGRPAVPPSALPSAGLRSPAGAVPGAASPAARLPPPPGSLGNLVLR